MLSAEDTPTLAAGMQTMQQLGYSQACMGQLL